MKKIFSKKILLIILVFTFITVIIFIVIHPIYKESKAINIVKESNSFYKDYDVLFSQDKLLNNDESMRILMNEMKGDLKIFGWEIYKKVDEMTYVVWYAFNQGKGKIGYPFEVNIKNRITRNIFGDSKLLKKYGFLPEISDKMYGERAYFDLAYICMGKERWSKAEEYFLKILTEYPDGEYSPKAMFMVGFVNANYLKNTIKARIYFKDFLTKYPDNALADDAQYELENF